MLRSTRRHRAAFTLIELLTVISIILILVSMIVAVAYTGNNKQITANGSTTLVGWLKTMQAYALRDQKPYGLRIQPDGNGLVTSALYIETPTEYVGPLGSTLTFSPPMAAGSGAGTQFAVVGSAGPPAVDFSGGMQPLYGSPDDHWAVRAGDYLETQGGAIAQIYRVNNTSTLTCLLPPGDIPGLWGAGAAPPGTTASSWRIIRQPRAMIGADVLALPAGAAINTAANLTFPSPLPPKAATGEIDILFAPTGAVITPGLAGRDIRLWIVDTTQPGFSSTASLFQGEAFIVTIAIRTGLVSVQPVAPGTNPYQFVQDGKSSGY
jgi:prepilin-type N-terminal cleavage/methylation domain-containing protein